jgi:magnesium chelatase subunit D
MSILTEQRVTSALACAALDLQLRGVVLFDLSPEFLPVVGRWVASLLAGPGRPPRVISIGARDDEDALWLRVDAETSGGLAFKAGPLVDTPGLDAAAVIVANLARLGLAERRAAVMLLGADVAHLERSGLTASWTPRSRWIAACPRLEVGRVSPHLLDRFPIRVDAAELSGSTLSDPPDGWRYAVQRGRIATIPVALINQVMDLAGPPVHGARRELALARISRALATLDGRAITTPEDVDAAAALLGLGTSAAPGSLMAPHEEGTQETTSTWNRPAAASGQRSVAAAFTRSVVEADLPQPLEAQGLTFPMASGPYPEDDAEPEQASGSLRPWPTTHASRMFGAGRPIGTRPADGPADLAMTATIAEAARHQGMRCAADHATSLHHMHMSATDLRSYRRGQVPGRLFVLVLDHTCHGQWDWYQPLTPYLQWAYTNRAAVCVVEIGAANAAREVRAQRFMASNLLDPRVVRALEQPAGRCTPLAHGLKLAADVVRDRLHRGRLPAEDVLLVVVTDGRGNIPLASSAAGQLPDWVGREGVDDALTVGRDIRTMSRVHAVVVDPGPRPNAGLTVALSEAMGAQLHTDVEGWSS